MNEPTNRERAEQDEHPLDGPLGEIHEAALWLAHQGLHDTARRLAEAHEAIQRYLLDVDAISEDCARKEQPK